MPSIIKHRNRRFCDRYYKKRKTLNSTELQPSYTEFFILHKKCQGQEKSMFRFVLVCKIQFRIMNYRELLLDY